MQQSDTHRAKQDEGQAKTARETLSVVGEERCEPVEEAVRLQQSNITDLERIKQMRRRAVEVGDWNRVLEAALWRAMRESDTYLAILDEGQEKATRESILIVGEERLGPPSEAIRSQLANITDLEHLKRMLRRTAKAASWQEILATP
jgi:hypothetical protein